METNFRIYAQPRVWCNGRSLITFEAEYVIVFGGEWAGSVKGQYLINIKSRQ